MRDKARRSELSSAGKIAIPRQQKSIQVELNKNPLLSMYIIGIELFRVHFYIPLKKKKPYNLNEIV